MSVSLPSVVLICLTVTCSVTSEGAKIDLSRELTLYTGQNLTLSCQPRDSPKHLVYWYKGARNQKGLEKHISSGPSFTITKATMDDTAFYSCSAAEWGFWGIRHYILVNVIDPGKPSCANGWSLYKTSCFMHSARTVSESWCKAYGYCHKSFARLAKIPDNSESLSFIGGLANQVNASSVWIGSRTGVDFNCHNSQTGNRLCDKINGKGRIQGKCTDKLPFICERVLPDAPKDVSIEHINCTTVRVGWSMAASGDAVIAYHVELSTSDGNVVTRISSSKERSLLLAHLHPKIEYRVRVQAENAAGNGSRSSPVTVNTKDDVPTMTSTKNEKVIAGHSITLKCGQSHQEITWYKDESAIPLTRGQVYSIDNATAAHEGMYYCAVDNGPRISMTEVLVIETPVIRDVKGILLTQHDNGKDKRELLLLCHTANRHPPEYAWRKDGSPLVKGTDTVIISLEKNTAVGKYECHVTNVVGSASKSLVISHVGEPVEACKFDFEDGTLGDWVKTGTVFDNQPTYGDNPTERNRGQPANQQGDYWIGGAEDRPTPDDKPGKLQGDEPKGNLTSPFFKIRGRYITFLIGGGCDDKLVRAELIIGSEVQKTVTGKCTETMERVTWDVMEFYGQMAQIRLVDNSSGAWGHINFDDLKGDITCAEAKFRDFQPVAK